MELPNSVRYVKLGKKGWWWPVAKTNGEIHGGWSEVDSDLLARNDYRGIRDHLEKEAAKKNKLRRVKRDFEELRMLLDKPSQHVWVTFQDGYLWWCTVRDGIVLNPLGETQEKGHFWLNVDHSWSNKSLDGETLLSSSDLPGYVTKTAAYRATVCGDKNEKWQQAVLRIIRGEKDTDAYKAERARVLYGKRILNVIRKMQPEDFEELIEHILDRTGWLRLAKVGGTRADVDIEAYNATAHEKLFVQVKSEADQHLLDEYVDRFNRQREGYSRMIFAVHTPKPQNAVLKVETGLPVQVWAGEKIAELVVRLGLGERVEKKVA